MGAVHPVSGSRHGTLPGVNHPTPRTDGVCETVTLATTLAVISSCQRRQAQRLFALLGRFVPPTAVELPAYQ